MQAHIRAMIEPLNIIQKVIVAAIFCAIISLIAYVTYVN